MLPLDKTPSGIDKATSSVAYQPEKRPVINNCSAVILTKNEAINLQRCVTSLQCCQEVIVLDSGSTDDTTQIAQSLGALVFPHIQPPL